MNSLILQALAGVVSVLAAIWLIPHIDGWMRRRIEKRADDRARAVFAAAGARMPGSHRRPVDGPRLLREMREKYEARQAHDSDLGELSPLIDLERRDNFWRPSPPIDLDDFPIPASLKPLTATSQDVAAFQRNVDESRAPPPPRPLTQREQAIVSAGNPRRAAMLREMSAAEIREAVAKAEMRDLEDQLRTGRRTPVFHGDPYRKSVIWPMVLPYSVGSENGADDPTIRALLKTMPIGEWEPDPLVCPSDAGKTPESTGSVDPCPSPDVDLPPDVGNSGDTW